MKIGQRSSPPLIFTNPISSIGTTPDKALQPADASITFIFFIYLKFMCNKIKKPLRQSLPLRARRKRINKGIRLYRACGRQMQDKSFFPIKAKILLILRFISHPLFKVATRICSVNREYSKFSRNGKTSTKKTYRGRVNQQGQSTSKSILQKGT